MARANAVIIGVRRSAIELKVKYSNYNFIDDLLTRRSAIELKEGNAFTYPPSLLSPEDLL